MTAFPKYPSVRHHSELGSMIVQTAEEDEVLTPASEGWCRGKPQAVQSVPVEESTSAEPETVEVEVEAETEVSEAPPAETGSLDFQGEFGDRDGD